MNDASMKLAVGERVFSMHDYSVRQVNMILRNEDATAFRIRHTSGAHAIACGLDKPVMVTIEGHVGYYCAGMNQKAQIIVEGNAGTGLAENIMSGFVRVFGNASQSVGASGNGGLVVVEGNASARCGISMKGVNVVVGGDVGHLAAFMAQSGNLVVCGNAGSDLGDSIYEARLFVHGEVASLGADCVEKEMRPEHIRLLQELLSRAELRAEAGSFRRFGSARKLYKFFVRNAWEA